MTAPPLDLAAAQARAEQAMALYEASQHKHYTAVGCVPDLARLVLDLAARVREVEGMLAEVDRYIRGSGSDADWPRIEREACDRDYARQQEAHY